MRGLKAIHLITTLVIVVFTLYLGLTGTAIQLCDFKSILLHVPARDGDIRAMQGWPHIDLAVADADATYHQLKEIGAAVVPGRMEGTKVASMKLTDPEGNIVEITEL